MFGPALLVNPVTQPMYYDVGSTPLEGVRKTRTVYLPEGCKWFDFWDNQIYEGGQTIEAEAPLERIPLYVRSGSILPMTEDLQHANDRSPKQLYIRVYAGQNGSFDYYEDEGDNYSYEKGFFAVSSMHWDEERRIFTIEERKGAFPGMKTEREMIIQLIEPQGTSNNRPSFKKRQIRYTGSIVEVPF